MAKRSANARGDTFAQFAASEGEIYIQRERERDSVRLSFFLEEREKVFERGSPVERYGKVITVGSLAGFMQNN